MQELHDLELEPFIQRALEENWGQKDWTTDLCIPQGAQAHAEIFSKKETMLSGLEIAKALFRRVDPSLQMTLLRHNGMLIEADQPFLKIQGDARSILKTEKLVLSFLGRMCGISYLTHQYIQQLKGYKAQLLDARRNMPGLRLLERRAETIGGARSRRLCLTEGVLVRENHIRASGSITHALNRLLESLAPTLKIEVECSTLDQVQEAIDAGADLVILHKMSIPEITLAVRTVRGRVLLEASGSFTLSNIADIARSGVDFISSSTIVDSAPWADLSLQLNIHQ